MSDLSTAPTETGNATQGFTPPVSEPQGTPSAAAPAAGGAEAAGAPNAGAEASSAAASAPAPVPASVGDFVTKADLGSFLEKVLSAVHAAQPAQAVAAVEAPPARLSADEAPKVGELVSYLGRPAEVLEVLETERKDAHGNAWNQVMLHIGVFTQTHVLDAEDVQTS